MSDVPMRMKLSLRLFFGDGKCFGPGPAELLRGVDRCGSLRAAALEMNMAYSKAWTMLRSCEETLGFPLLSREVGGHHGGSSRLTPQGRAFLDHYFSMEQRLTQYGEELLREPIPAAEPTETI
ncbi:MAG: LysR family transcriptional regulator [Oscillospiraceae bacterium]